MILMAELNKDNICIGYKQVNDAIKDGNHVEINELDVNLIGRKYDNGEWVERVDLPEDNIKEPSIEEQILYETQYQTTILEMGGM